MISVVIQAGGRSTRMGRDKAFLPFPEKPLIQHVTDRFRSITDDLTVISPDIDNLVFLGLPVRQDIIPAMGPLGGLYTGLFFARYDQVAMIACDMPFASPALVERQAEWMRVTGCDVVLPIVNKRAEPLHALYRRETCLPVVRMGLEAGMRRLVEWHDSVNVLEMNEPEIRMYDPDFLAFFNINTPEDLKTGLGLLEQ